MKKLIILTATSILLLCSCEKDDDGKRISYYINKTGEGYAFFKFKNDSIAPIKDALIEIKSYTSGPELFSASSLTHVNTDNNGKYSFKFVKRIGGGKVIGCYVSVDFFSLSFDEPIPNSGNPHLDYRLLKKRDKIIIDTIFYYADRWN